jgi:invasion protein IalB
MNIFWNVLKARSPLAVLVGALCFHSDARAVESGQKAQLSYSQWTKVCIDNKELDFNGCLTGMEGRVDTAVVAMAVAETQSRPFVRVLVPFGMQLTYGTQLIVDDGKPLQAPYLRCTKDGCISQYELTPELKANLREGQKLVIQTVYSSGAPLSLPMPLTGFAEASDGGPTEGTDRGTGLVAAPQKLLLTSKKSNPPRLVYRPWTKLCVGGQDARTKRVCFTAKEGRRETGERAIMVALLEPEGDPTRLLRITLPLDLQIAYGTKLLIDDFAMNGPFIICMPNACWSDYKLTPDAGEPAQRTDSRGEGDRRRRRRAELPAVVAGARRRRVYPDARWSAGRSTGCPALTATEFR